jgi:hypothetical protein
MTQIELNYRSNIEQACAWLKTQTNKEWNLAALIERGVTPYVWLDYSDEFPALFGDATGGFAAPIFYEVDTKRLAAGSEDVLITMTKDADKIAIHLPPPGIRAALVDIRFLKKDLQGLVDQLKKEALPAKAEKKVIAESYQGINKGQVLIAFSKLVKFNLEKVLDSGEALFGDEGARIKSTTKGSKKNILWNPITLALGINDVYRVPMSRLKRVFEEHDFLMEWHHEWVQTLDLLGE